MTVRPVHKRFVMMDVYRVKRLDTAAGYGVTSVAAGTGGNTSGGFRDQLGSQLKDDYKNRVQNILDEMAALSADMLDSINILAFEQYLGQIKSLLSEIVKNAYVLNTEHIMELSGRQRIFASIGVVDQKLDELAKAVLNQNADKLDYLSKVDEIRGLLTDMLL